MASEGTPPPSAPSALTFMDLPPETQKEIFSHCSQSDLICLSLVSRHFRELAAAQLYRNFHIVFPDEDDPAFDSPIDGLAGGLDTFVTSDYDYAKHLKDISLDTLSAGDKAETAYKPYLFNVSCGKFMNTLLLLTLRKARALESFKWNIRVELSRPVYKALHQINSLKHVHIRLQSGPSLYETPPPLPFNSSHSVIPSVPAIHYPTPTPPQLTSFSALPPSGPPSLFYLPAATTPAPPVPKPIPRIKQPKKAYFTNEPPTFSGLSKLKSLSVLDIEYLDVVTEIKTCVRNSAGTLTKLKLSFSDSLGQQARKPPPELDPEESDPDDEFQAAPTIPPTQNYHDDVSGPAKAFRAQEEKKSQESVLGRIFDVEPYVVKKPQKKIREKEKAVKEEPVPSADPGRDFLEAIKAVSNKLMRDLSGNDDFTSSQQDILDTIAAAAKKYVESEPHKPEEEKKDASEELGPIPVGAKPDEPVVEETSAAQSSLFEAAKNTKSKDSQADVKPEDIDIEEPEEQLVIEPQDSAPSKEGSEGTDPPTPASEPSPSKPASVANGNTTAPNFNKVISNLAAQKANFKLLAEKLANFEHQANSLNKDIQKMHKQTSKELLDGAKKDLTTFAKEIEDLQHEMKVVEAEIQDAQKMVPVEPAANAADEQAQRISDYLKATRGLGLQSLSIYLVPVKASVLSRAVDLHVLKRLTLLNVGTQAPIWALLQKENRESPLPLRKVYTDNVSAQFLSFVSELEELHEFFILERDHKYKPESFAPKSNVTISRIRQTVLKKHMPTLKRLMIKNIAGSSWDADEKTIMLICKRGKQLQELACSMGIRAIHTFMQQLSGLTALRALHIVQLRNDDTCVWVMRETKKFLIDNLSHHPEMKLEWISLDDDDRVERIIRPSELPKKEEKSAKESKGKQKAGAAGGVNDLFPVLPAVDPWDMSSDSSDEDDDLQEQKIETVGDIHFYDVWGVRIFKKEVITGRL
ncbi:hypothetical protein GQ53DRAFT_187973 [Thozetella sp. PMI_491]|nr:hypothetical protein GQ53DRAFT_187973 [Thozetella sp. PMI_491]